jgi:hypothetical protein
MSESDNTVKPEELNPEHVKENDVKPAEKAPDAVVPVKVETEIVAVAKKERKDMNLVEILTDALGIETDEISMTPKMKSMLLKLSSVDMKYLKNIETFFNTILADKQVNITDIPVVMSLVQELFLLYDSLRFKISGNDIGSLFEFLIKLMILYKVKGTDALSLDQKETILKVLDCFIKAAVNMIELKETSKKMNSIWSKFSFSKVKKVNYVNI